MMTTWVVVGPKGLFWVGLCEDEADAWSVSLGWPHLDEVAERKRLGWYAAPATITWQRPQA